MYNEQGNDAAVAQAVWVPPGVALGRWNGGSVERRDVPDSKRLVSPPGRSGQRRRFRDDSMPTDCSKHVGGRDGQWQVLQRAIVLFTASLSTFFIPISTEAWKCDFFVRHNDYYIGEMHRVESVDGDHLSPDRQHIP